MRARNSAVAHLDRQHHAVLHCCTAFGRREPSIIKLVATLRSYNSDLDYALQSVQFDSSIMFNDTLVAAARQRPAQRYITDAQIQAFSASDLRKPDEFFKAMGDVAVNAIMPLCNNDFDCPLYWVRAACSAPCLPAESRASMCAA